MNESEAQRQVEQHLAWCNETLWDGEGESLSSSEGWEGEEESPSYPEDWKTFGPYCGCDTCVVREILAKALELECFQWVELPDLSLPDLKISSEFGVGIGFPEGSNQPAQISPQVSTDRTTEGGDMEKRKGKYRISIQRGIGMTSVTIEAPEGHLTDACNAAKNLLSEMPESSLQGEGMSISTIPGWGPPT